MIWLLSFSIWLSSLNPAEDLSLTGVDESRPVVVELFTSQGCGMCPEANRLLRDMAETRSDIIAIAYGVSYWDMFGWEDQYAKPEFMARQEDYVSFGEARRVFTPHFIINGAPQMLRFNPDVIEAAVGIAEPVSLQMNLHETDTGSLSIGISGPRSDMAAPVWLVTLEGGEQVRTIEKGSNEGLDMVHYNMAIDLIRLDDFSGGDHNQAYSEGCPDGLSCAVLVQASQGGPLLAAAFLNRP